MRVFRIGLLALLSILAAAMFGSAAGAATVFIPCGASIGSAVAGNPPGTVFQLAGSSAAPCTYKGQSFRAQNDISIAGDCSSPTGNNTVIDGAGAALLTDGYGYGVSGVTIQCVTIQHYSGTQLNLFNRWLLQNCTVQYSGGGNGVSAFGSSMVRKCRITSNYGAGIRADERGVGGDGGTLTIIGNEVTNNNTGQNKALWAAGIKILGRPDLSGPPQNVAVLDNYVHDNLSEGIWADVEAANLAIRGNTIIHNQYEGIRCETTSLVDIAYNVVNNNDYSNSPSYFGNIYLSNCANVNVHDNNVLVASGYGGGIAMETLCRSDGPVPVNNAIYRNTVTFLGSGGVSTRHANEGWDDETRLGSNCPADPHPTSPTSSTAFANTFRSPTLGDAHFDWGTGGGFYTVYSLAAVQSSFGSETGSTIATGNASVAGCPQIGCTGSGWPQ